MIEFEMQGYTKEQVDGFIRNREGFTFFRSFLETLEELPDFMKLPLAMAIIRYGINGVEPNFEKEVPDGEQKQMTVGILKGLFLSIRPNLDSNWVKYLSGCKGGKYGNQGGRPKKKTNEETPSKPHKNPTETPQKPQANPIETPNDNDNDNEKMNDSDNVGKGENAKRFTPPTIEELKSYILEMGYSVDAEKFFNFYESKGWYVGKNKMKNWRAAVANWEKTERVTPACKSKKQSYKNDDEWA